MRRDRPSKLSNLVSGFAASQPGQRLNLAVAQINAFRPNVISRNTRDPCIDDGVKNIEIDRLGDKIICSESSRLKFVLAIAERGEKDEGNATEWWY